jgi:hypothetical protein
MQVGKADTFRSLSQHPFLQRIHAQKACWPLDQLCLTFTKVKRISAKINEVLNILKVFKQNINKDILPLPHNLWGPGEK